MTTDKTINYTSGGEQKTRTLATHIRKPFAIFNKYAGEYWSHEKLNGLRQLPMLFRTAEAAQAYVNTCRNDMELDDDEAFVELYDKDKNSLMTRENYMAYSRSDKFDNELSTDDCVELFLGVLKGQSDITAKLLKQLCSDYDTSLEWVLHIGKHPLDEIRLLVHKGNEYPVIHESERTRLDEQAMYVCNDEEWLLTDEVLIETLLKSEVIPENSDEYTLKEAIYAVLAHQQVIEGVDWDKAMRTLNEWHIENDVEGNSQIPSGTRKTQGEVGFVGKHAETESTITCGHCGREYHKSDLSADDAEQLADSARQCLDDDCPGPKSITIGRMRNEGELRINATLSNDDEGLDPEQFQQLIADVQGLYAAHGKDVKVFARQDTPFVVDVV